MRIIRIGQKNLSEVGRCNQLNQFAAAVVIQFIENIINQ